MLSELSVFILSGSMKIRARFISCQFTFFILASYFSRLSQYCSYLPVRDRIPEFLLLARYSGFNWRNTSLLPSCASHSHNALPQGSEERVRCRISTPLANRRGLGRLVIGGGGMFGKPLSPHPAFLSRVLATSSE